MEVHIVQIGAGKVSKIRRLNYPLGVKVVALIVRDVSKYQALARKDKTLPRNVLVSDNLVRVFERFGNNVIWDILSDDQTHFDYVQEILRLDSCAKIILGKTPYKLELVNQFENTLKNYPEAKITITENYAVSEVTAKVKEMMGKYGVGGKEITVEFTKNRIKDIQEGRFIHYDIGVLGYEGAHMITILSILGKNFTRITECHFEDLVLSSGEVLKNQGSVTILGSAKNSKVLFYTAMNGKILNRLPQLGIQHDIGYGDETRYRIVVVADGDKKIVGQYDPAYGLNKRPYGRVWVFSGNQVVEKIEEIYDNTMSLVLKEQICFLTDGGCPNPMPIEKARDFTVLQEIFDRFKNQ